MILFAKSRVVKKRITIVLIAIVLFFGNEFIFTKLVNLWQPKPVELATNASYAAGILLGGISNFDKDGNGFLNTASDRFTEICILYRTGKIKKIIISGGALYKYLPPEGDFLHKKLLESGIPEKDIIVENKSRTTFENAAYTKKILDSLTLRQPLILVTSAIHLPRATRVFEKAGINVIGYPTNYTVINKRMSVTDYIIPQLTTINGWASFLKEIVGLFGYKLFRKA